jgi:hypothetical protein
MGERQAKHHDFWMAPRELGRMLQAEELTPSQFALVHLLGSLGADSTAVPTSYKDLACFRSVDQRTIERGFQKFRSDGAVVINRGQGRRGAFRVQFGDADYVRPPTRVSTNPPVPMSDSNSDTNSDTLGDSVVPFPASQNGSSPDTIPDTQPDASRVRREGDVDGDRHIQRVSVVGGYDESDIPF